MKQKTQQVFGNVYATKEYDIFNTIKGNREINELNLKKIINSMNEEQLIIPIIVNENFEIIDGQHRYSACKELNLPIYYFMVEGYGIEQVKRANINSTNWKKDDYLQMFIKNGYPNYKKLNTIINESGITIDAILKLLSKVQNKSKGRINSEFYNGELELKNIDKIKEFLEALKIFEDFQYYTSTTFVLAFMRLYFKDEYDHNQMKRKYKRNKEKLIKRNKSEEYLALICNHIYSNGQTKNPIRYSIDCGKFHK